jgi:S-DNA-T family DNA segregation ATPase FtsK/SpoIIIE
MSLLFTKTPKELKLIIIDPKMVELSNYKELPHLFCPVITDMKKVPLVLEWLTNAMDERYDLFSRVGVRKIDGYNQLGRERILEKLSESGEEPPDVPDYLPYIVIVIDELADMMMVAGKAVEATVTRIAQKSRAVGIHLVLATQRPSVDVITGLIKSNMPARLAFKVASKVDSRTILDMNGAEKLLGRGDMLFTYPGIFDPLRAQCTFVFDKEIKDVINHCRKYAEPSYNTDLVSLRVEDDGEHISDDLYNEAIRIVLSTQRGSVSLLQRRFQIGYTRAARLVDQMAKDGIVGDYKGSQAREVLMKLEDWEKRRQEADVQINS